MEIKKWIMLGATVLVVAVSALVIKQVVGTDMNETESSVERVTEGSVVTVAPDAVTAADVEAVTPEQVPATLTTTPAPVQATPTVTPVGTQVAAPVSPEPTQETPAVTSKPISTTPTVTPKPTPVPPIITSAPESVSESTVPDSVTTAAQEPAPTASPNKTESSDAHVHSVVSDEKAATCLETGYRKEFCSECGELLAEQKETAALEHDFVKSVWESPTCQVGGYYNNTCKRCGIVECVTEDPLPHEVEDITMQEGNCMEDTIIRHICKNCGVQVESDTRYTPYNVHNWVTEVVDGSTVTCCTDCGVVK